MHAVVALYPTRTPEDVLRHRPEDPVFDSCHQGFGRRSGEVGQDRVPGDRRFDGVICEWHDLRRAVAFPGMVEQASHVARLDLFAVARLLLVIVTRVIFGQLPEQHGRRMCISRVIREQISPAEILECRQEHSLDGPVGVGGHEPERALFPLDIAAPAVIGVGTGEKAPVLETTCQEGGEVIGWVHGTIDGRGDLPGLVKGDDPRVCADSLQGVSVSGGALLVGDDGTGYLRRRDECAQSFILVGEPLVGAAEDGVPLLHGPIVIL